MKLKWRTRLRQWLYNWRYARGAQYSTFNAPTIVRVRDHFLMFDTYGNIWKLTPTMDDRMPLRIELKERN